MERFFLSGSTLCNQTKEKDLIWELIVIVDISLQVAIFLPLNEKL